MKRKYTIEGLDCANCAMKVEKAIAALDGVEDVTLNFSTQTLTLKSEMEENRLFDLIVKTIDSVEDGTTLTPQKHEHRHHYEHEHHSYTTYKYTIEGLDCANCAIKIEKAIAVLDGIEDVTLNFSTQTLTLKSEMEENRLFDLLVKTIDSVEEGITLTPQKQNSKTESKIQNLKTKKKINKNALDWICIITALVLLAGGFILPLYGIPEIIGNILMAAASVAAGFQIVWSGLKSAMHKRLDEKVLTAVAVLAAICIGEFFEAAMVSVLFLLGEMLENRAVESSRRDIAKLSEIRPDVANVVGADGAVSTKSAESVEIGSTILVKPHERIPLDGVILKGRSSLDTSALTGESIPRDVEVGAEVMSGMMNLNGELYVKTTKACEDSAAARILRLVEESAAHKGKSEKIISRFAVVYTPIVMVCAIALVVLPAIISGGNADVFLDWLNRALVFLVASCPCALVISVPLGFYAGIGAASKKGVLIKGGKFIEILAKADAVAFDKTGTLTSGVLSVTNIETKNGYTEEQVVALAAAAEKMSVHPVAEAIRQKAEKQNLTLPVLSDYQEKAGCGVEAYDGERRIQCGNRRFFERNDLKDGVIYVACDGKMTGAIYTADTLRTDSAEMISQLKTAGLKKLVMLTGDSVENAKNIAKECGIEEYHATLLPQDKATYVKALHEEYTTLFVGDGINDAPVLAGADCGLAMGFGSEAAIEAADAVLSSGSLAGLSDAIVVSRRVMRIIRTNIVFALTVKALILALAVLGIAPMWLAVLADTGVSVLSVLNAVRILR